MLELRKSGWKANWFSPNYTKSDKVRADIPQTSPCIRSFPFVIVCAISSIISTECFDRSAKQEPADKAAPPLSALLIVGRGRGIDWKLYSLLVDERYHYFSFFLYHTLRNSLRYHLGGLLGWEKEHTTALIKALFAKPARRTIIFVQPISERISIVIDGGVRCCS